MIIKFKRKKFLTALKRVVQLVPKQVLGMDQYDTATIKLEDDNNIRFEYSDSNVIVRFNINAEEIVKSDDDFKEFGLDATKLHNIVSVIQDDFVLLDFNFNASIVKVSGTDIDKNAIFNVVLKPGYFEHKDAVDVDKIIGLKDTRIDIDEVKFVNAILNMNECPLIQSKNMSENISFYKDENGSTCSYTSTGSVVFFHNYNESFTFDESISISRRNMCYIASLCDGNVISIRKEPGKPNGYFIIKDTAIGDGYDIYVASRAFIGFKVQSVKNIIAEKPVKFKINRDDFINIIQRVAIVDPIGCHLTVNGDKFYVFVNDRPGNTYSQEIKIEPISEIIDNCMIQLDYKLLNLITKRFKPDKYIIEINGNQNKSEFLITSEDREQVSVIAGYRS